MNIFMGVFFGVDWDLHLPLMQELHADAQAMHSESD